MPSQIPDRKLIWFQHFHKAGGSSVIRLAQRNQCRFHPHHKNADPVDESGNWIEFWKYDREVLSRWLDALIRAKVDFIACEWGFPRPENFIDRDDLLYVTVFRHPIERLISNFLFDLSRNFTKCPTVRDYVNLKTRWSYHQPDYYVRTLNGLSTADRITGDHLAQAITVLQRFDIALVVERDTPWQPLEQLGWEIADLHENANRQKQELYARHISPTDLQFLNEINRLDLALYEHVARQPAACPPAPPPVTRGRPAVPEAATRAAGSRPTPLSY